MLYIFFPGQSDQGLWHHLLLHGTLLQERTLFFPSKSWPFLWHLYLEVCLGVHCQPAEHNVQDNLAKGTSTKMLNMCCVAVLLSMKERNFFLTDWFWRNSLMERYGLVRTFQSLKWKSKNIPNNFWDPFPQWLWPTGRKAAKHDEVM